MNRRLAILLLLALSLGIYLGTAATPPLLDDVDSSHALVSRTMLESGDWVTLYEDGIRYLEKAPLHYWLVAISYKLFGQATFQTRLPLMLSIAGLVLMVYAFAGKYFDWRAGFYSGLVMCTSAGVYLFTRVMIPEAIVALEFTAFLYLFLAAWNKEIGGRIGYWGAAAVMGLMVLTIGLVGLIFPLGVLFFFILLTRSWTRWRELRLFSSAAIFLLISVPWHVLAEQRSPGFLWSYFINEHFKRALGTRYPPDYEAVPLLLWWALHLLWFFPWSIFIGYVFREFPRPRGWRKDMAAAQQARLLLFIWAGLILFFFSLTSGSRMEYYSFPAWPAIAMLLGTGLARAEENNSRWLGRLQGSLALLGLIATAALGYFLWRSLAVSPTRDISSLIHYYSIDSYHLSLAHVFDMTPQTFAILRGPSIMAMILFVAGFGGAWLVRRRRALAATLTMAFCMGIFFFAANWAFGKFEPRLSSKPLADAILVYLRPQDEVVLYGDLGLGSSIAFYTHRHVWIYNGRIGSNLEFGSRYPDAPPTFLDDSSFPAFWRSSDRVFLFVPEELIPDAIARLPPDSSYLLAESGGKLLFVNQPVRSGLPSLADLERRGLLR
jgi:4-amino-4-deoxy-L-arabinose transferase-like glycosyltransferase